MTEKAQDIYLSISTGSGPRPSLIGTGRTTWTGLDQHMEPVLFLHSGFAPAIPRKNNSILLFLF